MSYTILRRPCPIIDMSTPLCVILRLAKCHGIGYKDDRENDETYIDAIISMLFESFKKVPHNKKLWKSVDFSYAARFVNPDVKSWGRKALFDAYDGIFKVVKYSPESTFGPKTNHDPLRYDEIETYMLCRNSSIPTSRKMSFPDMIIHLRLINMPDIWRNLIGVNSFDLHSVTRGFISNDLTMVTVGPVGSSAEPSGDPLGYPRTNREAIINGVRLGIDFSAAKYPLLEYYYCRYNFKSPDEYIPVDEDLKKIQKINPFRLKFARYFNPYIPFEEYKWPQLNHFRSLERISRIDPVTEEEITNRDVYDRLCEISLCENFYHLLQPEVENTQTSFTMESFSEVTPILIVSYGVLSFSHDHYGNNKMYGYTIEELAQLFSSNKNFIDPINNIRFSDQSIEKLDKLCGCLIISDIPNEVKEHANNLSGSIGATKAHLKGLSDKVNEWMGRVNMLNLKDKVVKYLYRLIDTGMYMRKWKGPPDPYPLEERITKEHEQAKVDENVNMSMSKFTHSNNKLPKEISILDLPLVKYDQGHYVESNSEFDGLTIGDRITILSKGDNINEMSSCVRMSSNWMVGSAYYYLQLLEKRPLFNIEDMYIIS